MPEGNGAQFDGQQSGQPDQPAVNPAAEAAVDTTSLDQILSREDTLPEAIRLRTSAFGALEMRPEYLSETARWVRRSTTGKVSLAFPCGEKFLEVDVNNGNGGAGEQKDTLSIKVYPKGTPTYENRKVDAKIERSLFLQIPHHPDAEWPEIVLRPSEGILPRPTRRTIGDVEKFIEDIKTGFAEPAAPPSPAAPPTG